jgi:hypothetical protein
MGGYITKLKKTWGDVLKAWPPFSKYFILFWVLAWV